MIVCYIYISITTIGEMDAGMFYHEDVLPVGSFQVQLRGSKYWKICNSSTLFISSPGSSESSRPVCYEFIVNEGDILNIYATSKLLHLIIYIGDLVYYPPNWGHETHSLGTVNVAVSNSIIDILFTSLSVHDLRTNPFTLFIIFICDVLYQTHTEQLSYYRLEYEYMYTYAQVHSKSFNLNSDFCEVVYNVYKE